MSGLLCLPALADRGNSEYKAGLKAQKQEDYDTAYRHYKQAYTLAPGNPPSANTASRW